MASVPREERFVALYESSRARLLAYATRRTSSLEDAADAVAETFAIAWRRLEDVPDGEATLLWLFATARRVLANDFRRTRRRADLVHRIGTHLATRAESQLGLIESEALEARRALERLSESDRELLMLSGWEGLDSSELGYVLGCSPSAARIRLHHARSRLKAELANDSKWAKQPRRVGQSLRGRGLAADATEEL